MTAGFEPSTAAREREGDQAPHLTGGPPGQLVTDGPAVQSPTSGPPARPSGILTTGQGEEASTTEVAKSEAAHVADTAMNAGQQVAQTSKEQAGEVAAQASRQAKDLARQAQAEIGEQAASQQQRLAAGIRSLADEVQAMVGGSPEQGVATDLARQAGDRMHGLAEWLSDREPGDVLDEVRRFARRRPGAYLAIAVGAGVLAGRLARGLAADPQEAAPAGPTEVGMGGARQGNGLAAGVGSRPVVTGAALGARPDDPLLDPRPAVPTVVGEPPFPPLVAEPGLAPGSGLPPDAWREDKTP